MRTIESAQVADCSKSYAFLEQSMSVPVTKLFVQYGYIGGTVGLNPIGARQGMWTANALEAG